jgi:hypothetical protein
MTVRARETWPETAEMLLEWMGLGMVLQCPVRRSESIRLD